MGNLNARQPGLVGLLDAITDGRAPDTLLGSVQGVIDLREHVFLGKRERVVSTAVAVGAGVGGHFNFAASSGFTVPSSQAWFLYAYTAQGAIAAGANFQLQAHVQMPVAGGNQAFPIGDFYNISSTVPNNLVTCYAKQQLWLPPGTILGFTVNSNTAAAPVNITGIADYVRVRV